MLTAFDFEPICFANMPLAQYDYMAHGSDSEFTLRRNRQAFDWVDLVERPGTRPDDVNTSTELLGIKLPCPILIAPSTRQRDLAQAKAVLESAGTRILGVVINNVPASVLRRYYTRHYKPYMRRATT